MTFPCVGTNAKTVREDVGVGAQLAVGAGCVLVLPSQAAARWLITAMLASEAKGTSATAEGWPRSVPGPGGVVLFIPIKNRKGQKRGLSYFQPRVFTAGGIGVPS